MSWRMERTMFCLPTIYPGCTPIVLYSHCYCCVQYLYLQLTIVLETPLTIRSASGLCDHEFTRLIIFCTIPHIIVHLPRLFTVVKRKFLRNPTVSEIVQNPPDNVRQNASTASLFVSDDRWVNWSNHRGTNINFSPRTYDKKCHHRNNPK